MQPFKGAIYGKVVVDLFAPLRRTLDTPERSAHRVDLGAVIVESILHLDVDCAAQRVEAKRRIVGHNADRSYRRGWNQIPIDSVAERFVDAHPVLVDCKALGRSGHGRCDKATKFHVGLEWIAGDLVEADARHLLLQRVSNVQRVGARDLRGINEVEACGHFVDVDT